MGSRNQAVNDLDDEYVTQLILSETPSLRRLARRLARCEADADDLVQDTLLRAFRARDRFQPGTSMTAWTATNVTTRRRRKLDAAGDPEAALEHVAAPAERSEAGAADRDRLGDALGDSFKHALDRVPEVYRTPLLLSIVDELSCAEIAKRLAIPQGTVMSRIHRGRERLKQDLVYKNRAAA
jgi:RNA polymerase sigma-70 factor (ECF subfamily)